MGRWGDGEMGRHGTRRRGDAGTRGRVGGGKKAKMAGRPPDRITFGLGVGYGGKWGKGVKLERGGRRTQMGGWRDGEMGRGGDATLGARYVRACCTHKCLAGRGLRGKCIIWTKNDAFGCTALWGRSQGGKWGDWARGRWGDAETEIDCQRTMRGESARVVL